MSLCRGRKNNARHCSGVISQLSKCRGHKPVIEVAASIGATCARQVTLNPNAVSIERIQQRPHHRLQVSLRLNRADGNRGTQFMLASGRVK